MARVRAAREARYAWKTKLKAVEAAAVEVYEDWELSPAPTVGLFGCRREVEADGDVGGDGAVLGGNARGGVRGGRYGVGAEVALHAAALVDADELRHLEDDLVVAGAGACHGRRVVVSGVGAA